MAELVGEARGRIQGRSDQRSRGAIRTGLRFTALAALLLVPWWAGVVAAQGLPDAPMGIDLLGVASNDSRIQPGTDSIVVSSLAAEPGGPATPTCTRRYNGSYTPPPVRPAPAASAALIAQLVLRFGLTDIRGSLATVENLRRMERAFEQLPAECFQRLRITFERDNSGRQETGYWCPVDACGNNIGSDSDPNDRTPPFAGGHIYYFGPKVTHWILVHEVAHHVTIFQEAQLGKDMLDALGYRITATSPSNDLRKYMQFITAWDRRGVIPTAIPTPYSRQHPQEHLAELVAHQFAEGDREYAAAYVRGWRMPASILGFIFQKFGSRPGS